MTIRDDDPTIELNNKYTCICDVKKKKKKNTKRINDTSLIHIMNEHIKITLEKNFEKPKI